MSRYDSSWVNRANGVLAGYQPGVVPEFEFLLEIRMGLPGEIPEARLGVEVANNSLTFQASPERADATLTVPRSAVDSIIDDNDYSSVMLALDTESGEFRGNWARFKVLERGLFRQADYRRRMALSLL